MKQLPLTIPIIFLLALPAIAQELLMPNSSIPPKRVIEIQLQAMQQNDVPSPDFGITQTWVFAHPNNKRVTGPLERFTAMVKGPNYQLLLNHRQHIIKSVVLTENYALFNVSITTASEHIASFKWEVSKVKSGTHRGSWMTTAVSPPMQANEAIQAEWLHDEARRVHCRPLGMEPHHSRPC
jgi:hypothetical protein